MIWYLQHVARFNAENAAITALEADKPWIRNVHWRIGNDAAVSVDADLLVGEIVRSVTLTYPSIFPFAPPSIEPRGDKERWSGHQYGPGGELCLEFRADNWVPSTTGADMLRSAFHLLSTEAGAGAEPAASRIVPSAHQISLGQTLRGKLLRLVQTASLTKKIAAASSPLPARIRFSWVGRSAVAFVVKLVEPSDAPWRDPEIPESLGEWDFNGSGFALALASGDPRLQQFDLAVGTGAHALRSLLVGAEGFEQRETLVLSLPSGMRAFLIDPSDDVTVEYGIVTPDPAKRSAPQNASLVGNKVAVIGAGSIGSKVAASLARAGVCSFLLVDDDILAPENMVRHELDWLSVGAHKVEALSEHLKLLRPGVEVGARRQQLGGQEASESLDGILAAMAKCDIIVDASGNASAFNYAGSVAEQAGKPMAWARVFAGGYGGLIARSRPGIEPTPHDARASIEAWCANPEFPPAPRPTASYAGIGDDDVAMVADDADVAVIAAQFARLILDTLLAPERSTFESSAYMIGLRKEWIFQAAFDTWPVDLGPPRPAPEALSPEEWGRAVAAIESMLPNAKQ